MSKDLIVSVTKENVNDLNKGKNYIFKKGKPSTWEILDWIKDNTIEDIYLYDTKDKCVFAKITLDVGMMRDIWSDKTAHKFLTCYMENVSENETFCDDYRKFNTDGKYFYVNRQWIGDCDYEVSFIIRKMPYDRTPLPEEKTFFETHKEELEKFTSWLKKFNIDLYNHDISNVEFWYVNNYEKITPTKNLSEFNKDSNGTPVKTCPGTVIVKHPVNTHLLYSLGLMPKTIDLIESKNKGKTKYVVENTRDGRLYIISDFLHQVSNSDVIYDYNADGLKNPKWINNLVKEMVGYELEEANPDDNYKLYYSNEACKFSADEAVKVLTSTTHIFVTK